MRGRGPVARSARRFPPRQGCIVKDLRAGLCSAAVKRLRQRAGRHGNGSHGGPGAGRHGRWKRRHGAGAKRKPAAAPFVACPSSASAFSHQSPRSARRSELPPSSARRTGVATRSPSRRMGKAVRDHVPEKTIRPRETHRTWLLLPGSTPRSRLASLPHQLRNATTRFQAAQRRAPRTLRCGRQIVRVEGPSQGRHPEQCRRHGERRNCRQQRPSRRLRSSMPARPSAPGYRTATRAWRHAGPTNALVQAIDFNEVGNRSGSGSGRGIRTPENR